MPLVHYRKDTLEAVVLQIADEAFDRRFLPRMTRFDLVNLTTLCGDPLLDFLGDKFRIVVTANMMLLANRRRIDFEGKWDNLVPFSVSL